MNSRREVFQVGVGMLGGALLGAKAGPAAASEPMQSPKRASATGPITGGHRGWPFGAYAGDIGQHGYVEAEYFVSGEARRHQPVGSLTQDGRWTFETTGAPRPFTTRILVRRPKDPAKFNGTVVVEWTNVSAGYELTSADSPCVYDGMAHVAVSAQQVGLQGFPSGKAQGLLQWDAERYAALSHPGDSYSYDIFSQVARLVGAEDRNASVDPLGGLPVARLIAVGASQSAICLTGYFNAVQPREALFDAFMLQITPGGASGYDDRIWNPPDPIMSARFRTPVRLRDDLVTPLMVVNSENETLAFYPVRQPDTVKFRYWEVAGASHAPTGLLKLFDDKVVRDGLPALSNPEHHCSDVMWQPSYDAAIWHMHRWLHGGPPPPSQPTIDVVAGESPFIERDIYGNAKGGVRLPELAVPIARYEGHDERPGGAGLSGLTEPFTADIVSTLYPTHSAYVAQVEAAARAAEAAGVILPDRVQEYVRQAEADQTII
jgi:hypothetical protein